MEMKGFYFSLDALTASMILLATVGMLSTYTPQPEEKQEPFELGYLHAAASQNITNWDKTAQTQEKVLTHIYRQYHLGNTAKTNEICQNYFKFSKKYALYFSNNTHRKKACGQLSLDFSQNLATEQVIVPDVKINNRFIGPKTATMVIAY